MLSSGYVGKQVLRLVHGSVTLLLFAEIMTDPADQPTGRPEIN